MCSIKAHPCFCVGLLTSVPYKRSSVYVWCCSPVPQLPFLLTMCVCVGFLWQCFGMGVVRMEVKQCSYHTSKGIGNTLLACIFLKRMTL